jgi:hypothetical protein
MSSKLDFGKAVLQDQRTGDVYVDKDGNLVTIEDIGLALQECLVALKTIVGEELFDQDWGLDLFGIVQNPFKVAPTILITSMVKACLDPSKALMIRDVVVTGVTQDEDNENEYYVDIRIMTINGDIITLATTMGE